jgi:dephospho-CoA kinase
MPISLEGRHVLAFCGASLVGKSTVARGLATMLDIPYVSFGDYVRTVARRLKGRTATRKELQDIGQELVDSDPHNFCQDVLAKISIPKNGPLVVDGLRHSRIFAELRTILPGFTIHLIFLEADRETRIIRGENIAESELMRMDSHEVEKDQEWLRSHADIVVNATANPDDILDVIGSWVSEINAKKTVASEVGG